MYHIRKAKGKSDGLGGIYCRITVDGTRAEVSISRKVPIDKWDAIGGKVKGVSATAQEINELMRSVVNDDVFYLIGGNTIAHNGGYVLWFDAYDPKNITWKVLENASQKRDHFHAAVIDGILYAVG